MLPIKEIPLTQTIAAIGALGTAAFGIVDASKTGLSFINRIGLAHIRKSIELLTPGPSGVNSLGRRLILDAVEANWINGADLNRQKCTAISLINGHMIATNAAGLAQNTNVDAATLESIAASTLLGSALSPQQAAGQARFDLIVSTLIDEAYQRADQLYRNGTRSLAACVAVSLAFAGGWVLLGDQFWKFDNIACSLLVGLVAVPLAPMAKDVSSALAAVADSLQLPKSPAVDAMAIASATQAPKLPVVAGVAAAAKPLIEAEVQNHPPGV
ncbi:MAG: hypothetical protein ABR928_18570 [Terracidiphilus sp.]|jgi:hypothetical protein